MHTTLQRLFRLILSPCLLAIALLPAFAQEAGTGSIHGRLLNDDTKEYLYNARVLARPQSSPADVRGIEGFSDGQGFFRINNIPAGPTRLMIFYTGFPLREVEVTVVKDQDVEVDVTLGTATADSPLRLNKLVVTASREMSATALAVNSQRYSANTKSVVATDELGFIGDGSIAGAMKFLPGVDLEDDGTGYANGIVLSGAPSANVPVTSGGFDLTTSAAPSINNGSNPQRTTQLMQLSLNNIARIEINRSPTPDSPGSALAGSVNFVQKSAFERVKPEYQVSVFASATADNLTLGKVSGPLSPKVRPVYLGGTISAIVPVSDNFGFTISANHSVTPKSSDGLYLKWTANYLNTQQAAQNQKPVGTYYDMPNNPEHHSLYEFDVNSYSSTLTRDTVNLTMDYRPFKNAGTLTAAVSRGETLLETGNRQVRWSTGRGRLDINRNLSSLTSTIGPDVPPTTNTVLNNTYAYFIETKNSQESIRYLHEGDSWKADLGVSHGESEQNNLDLEKGYLFSSLFNLVNTNIRMENIGPWGPSPDSLTAVHNGTPVNPLDLTTFANAGGFSNALQGVSPARTVVSSLPPMRTKPTYASDARWQVNGSFTREFDWRFPLTVKVGFDYSDYQRDQRMDPILGTNAGFVYDGTDVSLLDFINPGYNRALPDGFGVPSSIDNAKLAEFFIANRGKLAQLRPGEDHRTGIANSFEVREEIEAAYIRFDSRHFMNRLWLVYGVRFEQTNNEGSGPYNDETLNYRRNASGQFVNANGAVVSPPTRPALIYTANSFEAIDATWSERGSRSRVKYGHYFPSINANYTVTDNMVFRAAYSNTIGRPDTLNIAPGITLPDVTRNQTENDALSHIRVKNPDVEPWTSRNISLSLEYYSKQLGDITLRAYRRFVDNAFVNQILPPDVAQTYLDLYGVDASQYPTSYVSTLVNVPGEIVTSGLELSTRYSLDEILPAWASGVQVKLSAARSTLTGGGEAAAAFGSQSLYLVPWSFGGGLSWSNRRFSIGVNGKWNSDQRRSYVDPEEDITVEPGTYLYNAASLRIDLDASVKVSRHISLFINGRDISGYEQIQQRYSPTTPDIAKNRVRTNYQPVWTIGARATF